jgi:hypothetical protein
MPIDKSRRAKWIAAGYSDRMGSAWTCDPPSKELIRVYHFTSAEHALSAVTLGRLKIARLHDLNDPFELMAARVRGKGTLKVLTEYKDAYSSEYGMVCFSANWVSPVLWSHYGSKHRGICLGFDVRRDRVEWVKYEDERILANLKDNQDPRTLDTKLQTLLRSTKYKHWSYEEEIRMFVPLAEAVREGSLHFYSFAHSGVQRLGLREVILGPECAWSLYDVRTLVSLRYPSAITYNARLAIKSFAVVPKEKTVP